MKRALILTDGKAGHENQSRAFARGLGLESDVVEVHFRSRLHKTASYLLDRVGVRAGALLRGLDGIAHDGRYAVVLGTGSGTFYAAKCAARRLGAKCAVVLYPRGYRIASFDCVLAPSFDRPAAAPNVVEIPANLVASDAAFYAAGVESFRAHYARTARNPEFLAKADRTNAVAVIVGGPNKCSTMTPEWMKTQLDGIFAANPGAEFWVTTSRRTPPEVEAVVDAYPWNYRLLYSRDRFNPIPAFVSLARRLYVTAESTGMLSEACTSGAAQVYALDNLDPGPHKFRRFVEGLVKDGYARMFPETTGAADSAVRKVDLSERFARAKAILGME